ncbi:DUF4124 domain-containing protein [Pseudoalteromonas denitrificans]|jgi:hypothetical protein|uniref:DUF4124 domain-containing protein n=1 Tax=Pseudoalteromonas denitrificans DSM 6059 TaxID=1123010 RepID=A0A1I1Q1M8_9GAMM|nr:DUF4124 domain-containing protein [Pseudoalteromonas denitrificans]SFD15959.1 protein of unknown function [Pseudoalteromonas denitrificans DSM 6059]
MKKCVYLLVLVLVLSIVALFVLKRPDGQTWLTIDTVKPDLVSVGNEVDKVKQNFIKNIKTTFNTDSQEKVEIYRWQDDKGVWHFSDKASAATKSEQVWLDPKDITVLPAIKPVKAQVTEKQVEEKKTELPSPMTISPNKALKLMTDAKNIQQLVDQREKKVSENL